MARLQKRCEVQARAGEEAFEKRTPVLHPPEPVFTRAVSWARLRLAKLARDRFRFDQTGSVGLS